MTVRSKTLCVVMGAGLSVQAASAQCTNKTGFAKQLCEAQSVTADTPMTAAAETAMKAVKGSPITTGVADTIHLNILPPSIEPQAFAPLLKLARDDNGAFILKPGIYEAYVESYSLTPFDQPTPRGSAFFPAPIKGRRAKVISDILKFAELHPDVPQVIIQNLVGLTIYGTDLEKMPQPTQAAAQKLLPKETLKKLSGAARAKFLERIILDTINQKAPKAAKDVAGAVAAEQKIDQQTGINSAIKVTLSGGSDPGTLAASTVKGTWAQMEGGFFVRYLPEGYVRVRLQVIVPEAATEGLDPKKPLTFDPTQFLAVHMGTPAQLLGLTLRPVGGK
jgi:hypothetical protein